MTGQPALPATADTIKSCCAAVYSSDWMRLLIGDSFHPGGLQLTEHLGNLLQLGPGTQVLDIAAGRGTSAIHLARQFGCVVVGVDLSAANMAVATRAAAEAGVGSLVRFVTADAEHLAFPAASFDAVICECAFCTFPSKGAAAGEIARLLRPGGRLGLSDLTRRGELPAELQDLLGWVACIADALPVTSYTAHLRDAGLEVQRVEQHDEALAALVDRILSRLATAQFLVEIQRIELSTSDLDRAQEMARRARACIDGGRLGYAVIVAQRPSTAAASRGAGTTAGSEVGIPQIPEEDQR